MDNNTSEEKCKVCESGNVIMVEYEGMHPDHYDGISEIVCNDCKARVGRWSGNVLKDGETEPVGGKRK
jgi:hypothetical protein